jgi:hypothetical protein
MVSGWQLWDLKRGAREKAGRSDGSLVNSSLSPDGEYLAGFEGR